MESKSNLIVLPKKNNEIKKKKTINFVTKENEKNKMAQEISDDFEQQIEARMDYLENDVELIKSDSDPDFGDDQITWKVNENYTRPKTPPEPISIDDEETSVIGLLKTVEAINFPSILPFSIRRRLSECKEETEEIEDDENEKTITVNTKSGSTEVAGTTRKFIVTKTQQQPRVEAENLRNMTAKQNSQTISFPCSSLSPKKYPSIRNIFSPDGGTINPHLDTKFFDTSLVEVRQLALSSTNLDQPDSAYDQLKDDIWIPRNVSKKKVVSILFFFFIFVILGCPWKYYIALKIKINKKKWSLLRKYLILL